VGNEIPPGSTVLINSYLHRDPRHFPDPHIYRPERFLPDSPKLPPYTFIPFSAGSRNCIGSRFATSVIKVAVLSVLKAFRVEVFDTEDQIALHIGISTCKCERTSPKNNTTLAR